MSDVVEPGGAEPPDQPQPHGGDYAPSVAERLSFYQRAGGIVTPVLTAVLAFFIGGLVVLATGHNPLSVYKGILSGTGLDFFITSATTTSTSRSRSTTSSSGGTPTRTPRSTSSRRC